MGKRYRVKENFFQKWTNNSAYILGFIFADGHLEDASYLRGKYVRFTSTDLSIIKKIKQALGSAHKIVIIEASENRKEKYILRIGHHGIYHDLEALGLHPRKSHNMEFPFVPENLLSDFVRGYFDGDGTIAIEKEINKRNSRLKAIFTSGSKNFLLSLSALLKNCCGVRSAKVYDSHRSYQLVYRSKEALEVLNFIYIGLSEKDSLYLERKYHRYKQLTLRPDDVGCGNIFDKNSRIWTYNAAKAAYPSG